MVRIGARLREARLALGMSAEDIAHLTKIPRSSIDALEDGDMTGLPAPVFVRGFIRAYARTVNLDGNELVRSMPSQTNTNMNTRKRSGHDVDHFAQLMARNGAGQTRRGLRPSHFLLLLLAVGMLVAAWLMVGSRPRVTNSAASPAPAPIHQRVDGVRSFSDVRTNAIR